MKTNDHSGYAKNVTNMMGFCNVCASYDSRFKPGRASCTVEGMTALGKKVEKVQGDYEDTHADYTTTITQRDEAYQQLDRLMTYVLKSLKNLGIGEGLIDDVKKAVKRIKPAPYRPKQPGKAAAVPAAPGNEEQANEKATRTKTFENKLHDFSEVIRLLALIEQYTPSEPELTLQGLQTHETTLLRLNTAVAICERDLNTLRNNRHALLQDGPDSLMKVVAAVKDHVSFVYGMKSNQYKQLVKFKFTS